MARRDGGPELYEILATRRSRGQQVLETPNATERPGRRTTGREIIFSVEVAFIIFVAVVIFIVSAFTIGYNRGRDESRDAFRESQEQALIRRDDVETVGGESRDVPARILLDGKKFTLKLTTTRQHTDIDLTRLKIERKTILELPVVAEARLEAHLFDKKNAYILSVGVFDSRNDPELKKLKEFFTARPAGGNAPYPACSVEQIGLLGTPLL